MLGGWRVGTGPLFAPQEPWHAAKGERGQGRVGFAFASGVESGSVVLPPLLPLACPPGSASTRKSAPPALFPQNAELHQGQSSPVPLSTTSTWLRAGHLTGLINAGRWAEALGGGGGEQGRTKGSSDSPLSQDRFETVPSEGSGQSSSQLRNNLRNT